MKILLVYPESPSTFWSFHDAVKFISKKSAEPPLGLITVAALLPEDWEKKLIDMNITKLKDEHIRWADYLFITGMNIHKPSFKKIIKRSNELGAPVVAGGPMCTTDHNEFLGVSHFILNEAEITLPLFLKDLQEGCPKHLYTTNEFPDISRSPVPQWNLLDMNKYATMNLQYSRGCPYNCEFCSITKLNGHRPRTKETKQFIGELESLYKNGWQRNVFIVDDNFIGNKKKLKTEMLPAMIKWSKKRDYPFAFITEASINLADDEELVDLMVEAGFDSAFIGIETPNKNSLMECGKKQNLQSDMISSIKKLHHKGLQVSGGFIVGFDQDPPNIFEQQINFIKNSGIVTAMVGLLNAPTGTSLFQRLKSENRILNSFCGDNMDGSINFIPKMNYQKLISGYRKILNTIYSQKEYYERVKLFLQEYNLPFKKQKRISFCDLIALIKSMWLLGIIENGKLYFWKLFFLSLFKHPQKFPLAITLAIYGFHFRRVVQLV